ncbi:penicillin amidase [Pedobacter cryoconitis]|uniref:Penicillin amidase n=1 Tax=Pedobacter cryoconitis TaxID=188932 RepID=A0A127VEJ0_9SPHI|nr:penicillin acylase family protein [Pedobacter cryoconitis]AMP99725.1 penicillin amidase [Pedobacter cryoconitis]
MKKNNFNFIFPLVALGILIFALSTSFFKYPPLGKLLDPFIGVVQNERDESLETDQMIHTGSLFKDSVKIYFDKRKVPHIYAKNMEDLYQAQGYITASLRLWQMDFISYSAAGRLSEIFKDGFVDYDRKQRRIGMLSAAKASLTLMEKDPETKMVLSAYTRGVNAFINNLGNRLLPLEYKLLDYKPEQWTNLKTALIMKNMSGMLSGYEEDLNITNLILALGEEKFNMLFPGMNQHISPLINDSLIKNNQALSYIHKPAYLDYSFISSSSIIAKSDYDPRLGSNSWVVSGKKTVSGHPILCNDPHLGLSLPATWIEMQLSAPGINVYGVTVPGAPAIIIGFNNNIAWGITNGSDDVKDWYKLKITDNYKSYEFDGKWLKLDYHVEPIKIRDQKTLNDTIYHTLHGPVVSDRKYTASQPDLVNYALRWQLQMPSNDILAYIKLNKANGYNDYKKAIRYYTSNILNFTFASKENDIAVVHQGNLPVKWSGQGMFLLDGTKSTHLYEKYIPYDSLPQVLNPLSQFIISANQHPTNSHYAYYYNGYFVENRAQRIKQLLSSEKAFDIEKMKQIQLDNTSAFALEALPVLLRIVNRGKLSNDELNTIHDLSKWKGTYALEDKNAGFFYLWWNHIKDYTWDELKAYSFNSKVPDDHILLDLLQKDPQNLYFDIVSTSAREDGNIVVRNAFNAALKEYNLEKKKGSITWGDHNHVNINHMLKIDQLSDQKLVSAGYPETINAISSTWGPSWRMIVELGDRPKAYGIYPGGQSGNSGVKYYNDFVKDWNKEVYYPLNFYLSIGEASAPGNVCWNLK